MSDASPVRSLDEEEKEEDNLVRSSPERVWLRPPQPPVLLLLPQSVVSVRLPGLGTRGDSGWGIWDAAPPLQD